MHAQIEEMAFAESNNNDLLKATRRANQLQKDFKPSQAGSKDAVLKEGRTEVRSKGFVNAITKAQRSALGAKGAVFKVNCPCRDQTCLALWLCSTFRTMGLNEKFQVVKENKACFKYLTRHSGDECSGYSGKHTCNQTDCNVSPFLCKDRNRMGGKVGMQSSRNNAGKK